MSTEENGNLMGSDNGAVPIPVPAPSVTAGYPVSGNPASGNPAPGNPRNNSKRHFVISAVAVIAIISVLLYIVMTVNPIGGRITGKATTSQPSTTTSAPQPTTSVAPLPTNNTYLVNKSNILFGIPNASEYATFQYVEMPKNATSPDFNLYNGMYGLNFTRPFMTGAQETDVTYNQAVPPQYANYTYPVSIFASISEFSNPNGSKNQFMSMFGNREINGTYYFNTNSVLTQSPNNSILTVHLHEGPILIGNTTGSATDLYPIYTSMDNYAVAFYKGNYTVVINSYGINGKFNHTYIDSIAKHIYNTIPG